MYKTLTFCTLILLISCTGQQKETKKSVRDNVVLKDTIAVNDTLREPYHYHYLADISPREFAELIMKDSVRPSDNFSTFRVMDSLNAKSLESREFYFKAFLNIMIKADGAIAEAVGEPALVYVENHTSEFFDHAKTMTKEEFDMWANFVGFEISLSTEKDQTREADKYYKKLKENCSPEQKKEVDKFYRIIKKVIADGEMNESN